MHSASSGGSFLVVMFGVQQKPAFQTRFGVGLDCLGRAFGFAVPSLDPFVGTTDKRVPALAETVHGADARIWLHKRDKQYASFMQLPSTKAIWPR